MNDTVRCAVAEPFDLGELERFANTGALPTELRAARELLFDLGRAVRELRDRRETAERELRHHRRLCDEIGSLKRRCAALRGVLKRDGWKHVLHEDDNRRRRFEQKARKVARR